ncbi:unnamed protein product [Protopolystoma xenopodis]|uniref:Uncharacterized protein n=1 Tax=Protopolystoma xenopodis TaxID=117903 RepID=A0A3S5AN57_9PLAT|nr:unnamed protein product [Protopolystoma xenopodis]
MLNTFPYYLAYKIGIGLCPSEFDDNGIPVGEPAAGTVVDYHYTAQLTSEMPDIADSRMEERIKMNLSIHAINRCERYLQVRQQSSYKRFFLRL